MSSILEYLRQVPLPEKTHNIFSLQWWLEYTLRTYEEDPYHVLIEVTCFAVIIYLLFRPAYDPKKTEKLSRREEEELIAAWKPEPLCPPLDPKVIRSRKLVVESAVNDYTVVNGERMLELTSNNFLGLADHPDTKRKCRETIDKYGVGSCGPRGFYGTIDVHLKLEDAIAKLYGLQNAILYSDGIAVLASVIPAFLKKGDLIVADECVNFGIQQGISLSRSNVLYFKHNDMEDLERVLKDVLERDVLGGPLNRRFIIVEGLYQNQGDVCPLAEVVRLKQRHKFRLILDDSLALGVLGATGRGSHEHWGIAPDDIEAICATLDGALATVGGYCVGSKRLVDHQRLSGAGYCFSASAPPYTVTAGISALEIMLKEPQRVKELRKKAQRLRAALRGIDGITFPGDELPEDHVTHSSPSVHLRLRHSFGSRDVDEAFFRLVEEKMHESGIIVRMPVYIQQERVMPAPSLRMTVTVQHKNEDIDRAAAKLKAAFEWAFAQ